MIQSGVFGKGIRRWLTYNDDHVAPKNVGSNAPLDIRRVDSMVVGWTEELGGWGLDEALTNIKITSIPWFHLYVKFIAYITCDRAIKLEQVIFNKQIS